MRLIAAPACLLAAGAAVSAAQADLTSGFKPADLSVQSLTVTSAERSDGVPLSQVAVGQELAISCGWHFSVPQPLGKAGNAFTGAPAFQWRVDSTISVNREPIGHFQNVVSFSSTSGVHGPLLWRAPKPGRYRIRCALDNAAAIAESEERRANNVAEFTVTATDTVRGL